MWAINILHVHTKSTQLGRLGMTVGRVGEHRGHSTYSSCRVYDCGGCFNSQDETGMVKNKSVVSVDKVSGGENVSGTEHGKADAVGKGKDGLK